MRGVEWAAGLFEGEGTIVVRLARLVNREKSDTVDVQLSSVDEDVVREFARIVGRGQVYGPYGPYQPRRQPFWKWSAYSKDAQAVLAALSPYFLSRRTAKAVIASNINGAEYVEAQSLEPATSEVVEVVDDKAHAGYVPGRKMGAR
jgi:hypothetical protein